MGFRDIYNQLKGMKPLASQQVQRLKKVAMAPAIGVAAGAIAGKMIKRKPAQQAQKLKQAAIMTPVGQAVRRQTTGLQKVTPSNPNPRNPKNPTLYQRGQILAGGTEDAGSIRGMVAGAKYNLKKKLKR